MSLFFVEKSIFMKKNNVLRLPLIALGLLLANATLCAQDSPRMQPDLQNTEFFDPTQKNVEEPYRFSTDWRIEAGYVQWDERVLDTTLMYQHGLRLGATVDFNLPYRFSVQTGALLTLTYGLNQQHWSSLTAESAQIERMNHHIVQLQLTVPVRAYYNIKLWKELNLFFYAGPQLHIGLTNYDVIENQTSELCTQYIQSLGLPTTNHDRYVNKDLYRVNVQFGLGGGFEWDRYRLQAGYDFGLNNLYKTPTLPTQRLNEWGWMVAFGYRL